ncbi:MAG: Tyrosine recombinase XerC [candidate division WS2 bacterium]|nr:Tyrosine recombinase XerC [Candidatus Psychracetigena formicireducens]
MIYVIEQRNNNEVYFEIQIVEDGKVISTSNIYYKSVIKDIDGITYLMLYDARMQPVSEVFGFLNFDKATQSINSKIKSQQALKLLYSFQSIINKELKDFSNADINSLKIFLKGLSPKGQIMTFQLLSTRNNETINGYLSVYRQYLEHLGETNQPLLQKNNKKTLITIPDLEVDFSVDRYKSNEKVPKKINEVPRYISVEEFKQIIYVIREHFGLLEEIIVRLMFQCGLRIGEALGLTADDLVIEKIGETFVPIAYIRNRLSDKRDQQAKTCMKVIDKKQYRLKDYKTEGYGYQKVVVPQDLYDLINKYIDEAHTHAREHRHQAYYSHTIADRVRSPEMYEDDNYYVFINSLGKPLSSHLWNYRLREIFNAVGIPLDKNIKEHNLNHRFRHGFTMFNVQHLGCKEIELMHRLRHRNIASVSRYYKPTISDEIKIKTDFADSLYDVIPDLKIKE